MKWYVVHTHSGHEKKVRQSLRERVRKEELDEHFGRIEVSQEEAPERGFIRRLLFGKEIHPGYMLVEMVMTERTRKLVESISRVTGFAGGKEPLTVPDEEVERILRHEKPADGEDLLIKPSIKISIKRKPRND